MDFIAVDFETPNGKNDSTCAMGITFVKNSQIVFNDLVLVNPQADFDSYNIGIHGITMDSVQDKPTFDQVWPKYEKYFKHYPVVMHNASSDTAFLYKIAYRYGMLLPKMDFYCTKQLYFENYHFEKNGLDKLCERFSIEPDHHNPPSDSLCAAKLMLRLLEDENASIHVTIPFEEFKKRASRHGCTLLDDPNASPSRPAPPRKPRKKSAEKDYVQPACDYFDGEITIPGNCFVFTGDIPGLERDRAEELVIKHGGSVNRNVSKKVDFLIVGLEDRNIVTDPDGKSGKIKHAESLVKKGFPIHIIESSKFVEHLKIIDPSAMANV